ncbi:MAG: DNA mismatch repair endonuclease MutL [Chloroflexi bacterium]|nr:DNA mismatch repair endonuclease MutL [Chloroflexota bacterium]
MPIRQLPPNVAAQIAAGEVVERPASVVKELVENSLDAGASRISVAVREGGVSEIRASDDGTGIGADELALAFRHHATSKLVSAADLESVGTLGFRGEALPSIAAVARVTCTTRTPDAETGSRIEFRYGDLVTQGQVGCPVGTTVQVVELFGNVPARRRFLRSAAAETARIQEVVTRYALAYPDVRFALTTDGREQVNTPGNGNLQDVILSLYGRDVAARMLPVAGSAEQITVSGYTSAPDLSRHNRSSITLLVNRRWVYHRSIMYAIERAYQGTLPDRRYPLAVINVDIPAGEGDVNSHPTKREVRFRNANRIFSAVQRAVSDALVAHAPVRQVARSFHVTGEAQSDTGDAGGGPVAYLRGEHPGAERPDAPRPNPLALPTTGLAPTGGSLRDVLTGLRVVGQIRQTYIVAEGNEGMYLVDQHAAHERVVYDRIRQHGDGRENVSQPLLGPAPVELSLARSATLQEYAEMLADYGFQVEPFGGDAWLVRAVPAALTARSNPDPGAALIELLDAVSVEQVVMEREDALAATIACHGSVRAGDTLGTDEMDALLRQLETTENPHHCPHGRPTVIHFTEYQLEREFGRR